MKSREGSQINVRREQAQPSSKVLLCEFFIAAWMSGSTPTSGGSCISVQRDGGNYCCIALTNPTEVIIIAYEGTRHVGLTPV